MVLVFLRASNQLTQNLFQLFDWVSNRVDEAKGSYVQWKPVCYTLPKRSITAITKAKNYDLKRNMTISGMISGHARL